MGKRSRGPAFRAIVDAMELSSAEVQGRGGGVHSLYIDGVFASCSNQSALLHSIHIPADSRNVQALFPPLCDCHAKER